MAFASANIIFALLEVVGPMYCITLTGVKPPVIEILWFVQSRGCGYPSYPGENDPIMLPPEGRGQG